MASCFREEVLTLSVGLAGAEVLVASVELAGMEALVLSVERVDVALAVPPLPAGSLEVGVCLQCLRVGAPWGPLLAAGEVYRLAVDGVDPHWDVALPLV